MCRMLLKSLTIKTKQNHAGSISHKYIPFFGAIKRNKSKIMASTAPEESSSNQKVILVQLSGFIQIIGARAASKHL